MAPPQGDSSGGRRPPRKAAPRPGGKPGGKPGRRPSGAGDRSGRPPRRGGESGGGARGRGGTSGTSGTSGSRPPRAGGSRSGRDTTEARGGSGGRRGGRPTDGGDRRPRRASDGGSDRPGRRPAAGGGDRGRRESAGGFAYGAAARKDKDARKDNDARPGREEPRGPRSWGGLARRGAGRITSDVGPLEAKRSEPGEAWEPEQWIDEGELRDEATGAVGRSRSSEAKPAPARRRRDEPAGDRHDDGDEGEDAARHVPPERRARFEARLRDASEAFRRERYDDARRLLRPLAEQAPGAASVRELYGLTLYRLGRWAQAQRELEAFHTLTGSAEQNPVLADSLRALGRYDEVDDLWEELRAASPSAELVAEGRIVTAGAWADQGRLDDAIGLLESAAKPTKRPKLHHLRIAYALADLYERSGDLPRARELFRLVADNDPDFVDVAARLRALR